MARVDLPAGPLQARRRRRRVLAYVLFLSAIVLLFALLVWLSHASFLRADSIVVEGARTLGASKVQTLTEGELEGNYLFIFSKRNIFSYPARSIEKNIIETYPVVKVATVEAIDFNTIQVSIVERTPKALWCKGSCYYIDEDGIAYEEAPSFSSPVYISYEGGSMFDTLPAQYLTQEEFRSLSALIDALSEAWSPYEIERVRVDAQGDVYAYFENGFELRFVLADHSGDVYERFILARTSEPFKGRSLGDFEYLDLRFGDKLYYLEKNKVE